VQRRTMPAVDAEDEWGPLEEAAASHLGAVSPQDSPVEEQGADALPDPPLRRDPIRTWRDSSGWAEVASSVRDLKHEVGNVRAEIKADVTDASKEMREIKARLAQLVYRETERVQAAQREIEQHEQREREAISQSAASLLLEQEGPAVPAPEPVRKRPSSRGATPDQVGGWKDEDLPLVKGPLSPTARLSEQDRAGSPERPKSRGGKSPPRSPHRKGGATPWVNTEVDGVPPDPDGPDGIDGGRFPRLPMSPTPPPLARPPSADSGTESQRQPMFDNMEDPYAVLGEDEGPRFVGPADSAAAVHRASGGAAATGSGEGESASGTSASKSPRKSSPRSPPMPTLSSITVGEHAPEHWGFPDQFFDSLPSAEAGGATSNMMPVTTGGYEFRPNLGAGGEVQGFGGGGAQPHLERDIAIITKHQLKEREERARSRQESRRRRREMTQREEVSSRGEHMGDDDSSRSAGGGRFSTGELLLPETPPHSGGASGFLKLPVCVQHRCVLSLTCKRSSSCVCLICWLRFLSACARVCVCVCVCVCRLSITRGRRANCITAILCGVDEP
jgi:hypothetical protein